MSFTAAVDQLSASARDEMPNLIHAAHALLRNLDDRDQALAALTLQFQKMSHSGVAAIAADALLRLAEENR